MLLNVQGYEWYFLSKRRKQSTCTCSLEGSFSSIDTKERPNAGLLHCHMDKI
jgi:hypothetical protein